MIPPMTGNGMSMAFESAELAVDPIERFSRGKADWTQVQEEIATQCDRAFGSRLLWASWLQRALFFASTRSALTVMFAGSEWFWRSAFQRTR